MCEGGEQHTTSLSLPHLYCSIRHNENLNDPVSQRKHMEQHAVGLVSKKNGDNIPLVGTNIWVNILDVIGEVELEQTYINQDDEPIEATYKVFHIFLFHFGSLLQSLFNSISHTTYCTSYITYYTY